MTSQFVRIGEETHFALSLQENPHISSLDDYILLCRDIYSFVEEIAGGSVDLPGRSTEFHYYGVTGAPGGEILAPMIWSISHFPKFFGKLIDAQSAFVIGSPIELVLAADSIETVYTANHSSIHLLNSVRPLWEFDNVITLPWATVKESIPQVDCAQVVINYIADQQILDSILSSIKPGGLLIISNSSNGGELYNQGGDTSLPHEIHDYIKSTNNFDVMHMQGYISYTLCVRR
jgi:hypothetical protein